MVKKKHLEQYPSTRLGKIMRAENLRDILMYCEEFIPGNILDQNSGNLNLKINTFSRCVKVFQNLANFFSQVFINLEF